MGNLFSSNQTTQELVTLEVVNARNVYNTLNDLTSYLVILDIRSTTDYKQSHLDLALNPTCVDDMLYHTKKSPFTTVIIYGKSNNAYEEDKVKISLFCSQMNRHRINEEEGPLIVLHLPDFNSFYTEYPFQCTNSSKYEEGRLYPSQITDNIFLSNFGAASSKKVTTTLGITHILNCTKDCPFVGEVKDIADSAQALNSAFNSVDDMECSPSPSPLVLENESILNVKLNVELDDLPHLSPATCPSASTSTVLLARIPVIDEKDQQIHEHFDNAIKFLSSMNSTTDRAIIHCKHGQSRSATIAAAYLIHKNGWGVEEAIAHLKSCRPKVCPNEGFISQLDVFAKHHLADRDTGNTK